METLFFKHVIVVSYKQNTVMMELNNASVYMNGDVVRLKGFRDDREISCIFKLSEVYLEGFYD